MSLFFVLNNLHFALEILGALVFLMVAWLAFDAFLIRRDFLTASRAVGFLFLSIAQVLHAFNLTSELFGYFEYFFFFTGLVFAILNLVLEAPVDRPEFKSIVLLPAVASLQHVFNFILATGFALIAFFSYRQYKKEFKFILLPLIVGFTLIAFGYVLAGFYEEGSLSSLWIAGHALELAGFIGVGWWVWQYLQLRIREEMLLIFISMALFIAVIVSLTFSTILVNRIEEEVRVNLLTDAKVLDLTIRSLKEESLAKTRLLAENDILKNAIKDNNFVKLESESSRLIEKENLGFLIIADEEGRVILRAHALAQKDDNLRSDAVVVSAIDGRSSVDVMSAEAEGFSVRAASPIKYGDNTIGVIVAGYPLDNVLADNIKKITGLEMSIYDKEVRVATTEFNPDGRTRSTGIKEVNGDVLWSVLANGNALTLRTTILSRPYVASYLPVKNAKNEIVGMLSAAKSQQEILETADATNRLTLVTVVIIMIILILPIYFITKRLAEEI